MTMLERLSPLRFAPIWVRHQHYARYEWAAQFCRGQFVVDAACGTGYGSAILHRAGAHAVHGFDICCDAIDEARRQHVAASLTFTPADVAALPLADASADLFVSFETIEHLPDERGLLAEAARVLRPGGIFLCSSPNRSITNPGTTIDEQPFNPHHCREYTPAEFDGLLRRQFAQVAWYGQTLFTEHWRRTLDAAAGIHRGLAVKVHQVRKLLYLPLEHRGRHVPRPIRPHQHPEILVALCCT